MPRTTSLKVSDLVVWNAHREWAWTSLQASPSFRTTLPSVVPRGYSYQLGVAEVIP